MSSSLFCFCLFRLSLSRSSKSFSLFFFTCFLILHESHSNFLTGNLSFFHRIDKYCMDSMDWKKNGRKLIYLFYRPKIMVLKTYRKPISKNYKLKYKFAFSIFINVLILLIKLILLIFIREYLPFLKNGKSMVIIYR